MGSEPIVFRPVERSDAPLLRRWLEAEHVRQWWPHPIDEQLEEVWELRAASWGEALLWGTPTRWLGYMQWYDAFEEASEFWRGVLAHNSIGLDMYIGEADALGQGYGSRAARAIIEQLHAAQGWRHFHIDPHVGQRTRHSRLPEGGFQALEGGRRAGRGLRTADAAGATCLGCIKKPRR